MKNKIQSGNVVHPLSPIYDHSSRILILGTLPSPASREAAFYYGHPQNRFWKVLSAIFDEPEPSDNKERERLLLRHHIALWDVLARCDITGAQDTSIRNPVPNDLSTILMAAPIHSVFTTGMQAYHLYMKLCFPHTGIAAVALPSTSPANCRWSLEALIESYGRITQL